VLRDAPGVGVCGTAGLLAGRILAGGFWDGVVPGLGVLDGRGEYGSSGIWFRISGRLASCAGDRNRTGGGAGCAGAAAERAADTAAGGCTAGCGVEDAAAEGAD
jgi:hypothetical protein